MITTLRNGMPTGRPGWRILHSLTVLVATKYRVPVAEQQRQKKKDNEQAIKLFDSRQLSAHIIYAETLTILNEALVFQVSFFAKIFSGVYKNDCGRNTRIANSENFPARPPGEKQLCEYA